MKKLLGLMLGLGLVMGSVALAQDTPGKTTNKAGKKGHKGGKKGKKSSGGTTTPAPK